MDNELCIKIADEISDKLISLCQKSIDYNKTFLEIYKELVDEQYKEYLYDILTYIPERLAIKGYEICNSNYFELKKY